jgi:hypothetical protein
VPSKKVKVTATAGAVSLVVVPGSKRKWINSSGDSTANQTNRSMAMPAHVVPSQRLRLLTLMVFGMLARSEETEEERRIQNDGDGDAEGPDDKVLFQLEMPSRPDVIQGTVQSERCAKVLRALARPLQPSSWKMAF